MTHDLIDDRLIGALHLHALTRAGLAHDPVAEHAAVQAGTIQALLDGRFDGDLTLAEAMSHGTQGIGTIRGLDGELIVLDGAAWVVDAHGAVREVAPDTPTPFVVVTHFEPDAEADLAGPLDWAGLTAALDALAPHDSPFLALRVTGTFTRLRLRSVPGQSPPYPSLTEVTAHQVEWDAPAAIGTLVGFRFPDATAGIEVPAHHLHFLADDRTLGGHVMSIALERGELAVDPCHDLHVELPPGMALGQPGTVDRSEIARIEGGSAD